MDGLSLEEGPGMRLLDILWTLLIILLQLLARRGKLPDTDEPTKWTCFEMPLREDTPVPVAFDFTRFLASSITFMSYIRVVSVYFDDKKLTRLTKSVGIQKELGLPKTLNLSKSKMMALSKLQSTCESIARALRFFNNWKSCSITYPGGCDAMGLHVRFGKGSCTFGCKTCEAPCLKWILCFPVFRVI